MGKIRSGAQSAVETSHKTQADGDSGPDRRVAERLARLRSHDWPIPSWYQEGPQQKEHWYQTKPKGKLTYRAYYAHQLRSQYMQLETTLQRAIASSPPTDDSDVTTAERAVAILTLARQTLESPEPDLLSASGDLDLAERLIIPITPYQELKSEVLAIDRSLQQDSHPAAKTISEGLRQAREEFITADKKYDEVMRTKSEDSPEGKGATDARNNTFWSLVGLAGEALEYRNNQRMDDRVSIGLQNTRLSAYRLWGSVVLTGLLLLAPIASKQSGIELWTSEVILGGSGWLGAWLAAVAVAALGGAGGYLSGLLQARGSRVGIPTYKEAVLNAGLRPIVGASTALVLFILLTWQVIPGVAIESAGTYVFVAFLAGFSERYFLKVLKVDSDEAVGRNLPREHTSLPSPTESSSGERVEAKDTT